MKVTFTEYIHDKKQEVSPRGDMTVFYIEAWSALYFMFS